MPEKTPYVLVVTDEGMGNAEPALQKKLIKTYFALLNEHDLLPSAICFYTKGVRLVVEGSPVLAELRALEEKGVRLILCSTCLEYFGLAEKVEVGIVGGMTDILEAQWMAEKIINL